MADHAVDDTHRFDYQVVDGDAAFVEPHGDLVVEARLRLAEGVPSCGVVPVRDQAGMHKRDVTFFDGDAGCLSVPATTCRNWSSSGAT
jgi:hypothetical protein